MAGRLRRLAPATVLLVAETVLLALAIELALRSMPLARVLSRLERWPSGRTPARDVDAARLRRVAAAVCRLLPMRATCLRESLVLLALLRRRGHPSRLRIGVRKNLGKLAAHAWVEGFGSGTDDEDSRFFPLTPIRPVACSP